MAGRIKQMIDSFITQKSKGNQVVANSIKVKLIFKGINPDKFNNASPDDQIVIDKLNKLIQEIK